MSKEITGERVTKILHRSVNDLEVQYEAIAENGGIEKRAVRSPDPAEPRFYTLLQRMRTYVLDLLDLPEQYSKGMGVNGVELKWDGALAEITFTAEKEINGLKPFKIKTPPSHYGAPARMEIEELCEMALRYAKGERSQLVIDFSRDDDEDDDSDHEAPVQHRRGSRRQPSVAGVH